MIQFKYFLCDLGSQPKGRNSYKVRWDFTSTTPNINEEIESIQPSCGCTAELTISQLEQISNTSTYSGFIEGTYTSNESEIGVIEKSVIVWMRDSQEKTIPNSVGGYDINPNKLKSTLKLRIDHGV